MRYFVYILTNTTRTVLYTGVTNDPMRRFKEHQSGIGSNFTNKYKVHIPIYVETYAYVYDAIAREKQIKNYSRKNKEKLIRTSNPDFRDISGEIATLRSQ